MSTPTYLTLEELIERYRNRISEKTLANWRSKKIGPSFTKIGKAFLYPLAELERWEQSNLVVCQQATPQVLGDAGDGHPES